MGVINEVGWETKTEYRYPSISMPDGPIDEAVVHADGWFVIRNTDNPEQWLAIDEPMDIRR